jgi:hypothetical protein
MSLKNKHIEIFYNELKGLLASTTSKSKYDIDVACQTLELVSNLKTKIQEDFATIDSVKEKLSNVSSTQFVLESLDSIKEILKNAEAEVDQLLTRLTPKSINTTTSMVSC